MGLRIVDDDLDFSLDIPADRGMREAISIQIQRCLCEHSSQQFETQLVRSIASLLDYDIQPPTQRQICYAKAIARALPMTLPPETLQFRGPMSDFLRTYAPIFQARQSAKLQAAAPPRRTRKRGNAAPKVGG